MAELGKIGLVALMPLVLAACANDGGGGGAHLDTEKDEDQITGWGAVPYGDGSIEAGTGGTLVTTTKETKFAVQGIEATGIETGQGYVLDHFHGPATDQRIILDFSKNIIWVDGTKLQIHHTHDRLVNGVSYGEVHWGLDNGPEILFMDYAAFAHWTSEDLAAKEQATHWGVWGYETAPKDMPKTGTATYGIVGRTEYTTTINWNSTIANTDRNTGEVRVDFGTGAVNGEMDIALTVDPNDSPFTYPTLEFTATIAGNGFDGTDVKVYEQGKVAPLAEGVIAGRFFGGGSGFAASEIGATWQATGDAGLFIGSFIGRKE